MTELKKLLTAKELARLLGMSLIYIYLNQKEIPHIKMGRTIRFDEAEIKKWIKNKRLTTNSKVVK